jgi:hypothetical protein
MISEWSAIELKREIDRAADYVNDPLHEALVEVERLRVICQDIVELINTDNRMIVVSQLDPNGVIKDIEELAHKYYTAK